MSDELIITLFLFILALCIENIRRTGKIEVKIEELTNDIKKE
jgi:hypothetical protein